MKSQLGSSPPDPIREVFIVKRWVQVGVYLAITLPLFLYYQFLAFNALQLGVWFGTALVITDVTSGKQIRTINVPNTRGNLLAISTDGRFLASACQAITGIKAPFDEKIHLWEIDTGKELMAFDASSDGTVASLVFLPDGKTLVSGMNRGTALLWDVSGMK